MKHLRLNITVLALVASVTLLYAQGNMSVKVNPRLKYQTLEGWGASLCWWAHMVGQWDDEKKIDEVIDLITSPDKLNMNLFRYNIGGGDDPSHYSTPDKPGHMAKGKGVRAEMEGFKASQNSGYDWSKDAGQRKIMLKIKEKRPDAVFEAFSNSPPYWMTFSGCSGGNDPSTADNLKPEYYEQFCDYLIEVCKHYKDVYGIEFKTLEPFNESFSPFWGYKGSQEGCHFEPESQIKLLKMLYPKLKSSGLKTVISASDETNLSTLIAVLNKYIDDGEVLDMIEQINVHTYSGTDQERLSAGNLVKFTGKHFWQSETGQFERSGFTSNLFLAQKCFDDLRLLKPHAWLDWQVMEENNDTWCTIRGSFAGKTFAPNRNFYVRKQVNSFIKQGYIIIDTDKSNFLAAIDPSGKELVVCCINLTGEDKTVKCDLSSFTSVAPAELYMTSSTKNCEKQDSVKVGENGMLEFNTQDHTITTAVIQVQPVN